MSTSRSMNVFLKSRYFLLYSMVVFFVPLIYTTGLNELFEFPKLFFFYFMTSIILMIFLIEYFFVDLPIIKPNIYILVMLGISVLATLFSADIYTSINGYYTRFNDSSLSFLVFFIFYFIMINKLTYNEVIELLKIASLSILISGIYGVLQHFGIFEGLWPASSSERVFSTFGQPNWFAQYLAVLLPFTVLMVLKEQKKFIWIAVYLVGFPALWFTYSLSGIFSFFIAMTLLVFFVMRNIIKLKLSDSKLLMYLISYSVLIMILFPGIFVNKLDDALNDFKNKLTVVTKVYAVGLETYIEDEGRVSDPGFIRLGMWEGTLRLIFSTPKIFLIGAGPETFPYLFQKYRPLVVNYSSEWEYVLNKPHNYYLELWAEEGIFMFVIYLFFGYILYKKSPVSLKPSIAAFYSSIFLGWPAVATSLVWWIFVGLISYTGAEDV